MPENQTRGKKERESQEIFVLLQKNYLLFFSSLCEAVRCTYFIHSWCSTAWLQKQSNGRRFFMGALRFHLTRSFSSLSSFCGSLKIYLFTILHWMHRGADGAADGCCRRHRCHHSRRLRLERPTFYSLSTLYILPILTFTREETFSHKRIDFVCGSSDVCNISHV